MTLTSVPAVDAGKISLEHGVPVVLACADTTSTRRVGEPVTFGVPLPPGAAHDAATLTIVDGTGQPVPTDARALDLWADGSIRWLLVDAQVDAEGRGSDNHRLRTAARRQYSAVRVNDTSAGVTVDTSRAVFTLSPGSSLFAGVVVGDRSLIDPATTAISARAEPDQPCAVAIDRVVIEESGALRAVVRAEGAVRAPGGSVLVELSIRLHFYANSATVRALVRVRNPRRAVHADGFWDLGDAGSVYLRDLSLTLGLARAEGGVEISCSPELGAVAERMVAPFSLYQDSSGGHNWQSSNHMNRRRAIPMAMRGYRMRSGSDERYGLRATPVLTVRNSIGSVAVTMPKFWQNFPLGVEANDHSIAVRLFPADFADVHEIQGGEQKTHEIFLSFDDDPVTAGRLAWCRSRLIAHVEPRWYSHSAALPYLTVAGGPGTAGLRELVDSAITGTDTFEHKREIIDQYGWRHFGEIYGDHEAIRQTGPVPLVSHYNNQYDPVCGFARQFFSTADVRWWTAMMELAAHVVDIDVYHTVEDKWAYNHGLFWHTYHYGDADISTHRTYPRACDGKTHGGGPSGEHNYTTGLMLHYFLTGDPASREAAIDLGQFVIDADDGAKTIFKWLDRGHTGFPTASGNMAYHGPGRGPANSLNALLDALRLSGRREFLDKTEQLIRRCIHPTDDVASRNLLDAERKWFYTMFLQSLGKYLDEKASRGEDDQMFAYGRASLLHYARWMADHERPYLDHPENLEFPTETWAAQDIRKSDVFYFAARHAAGAERARFIERAEYFFTYSTTTLAGMPTRRFARPVIVLLSSGWLHPWFRARTGDLPSPPALEATDFGRPDVFVPQKPRAIRRAAYIIAAGAGLSAAAALYWLLVAAA